MSNNLSMMRMRTPGFSAFPIRFENKFSSRLGRLQPVACVEMGPNDRLKLSLSQLSRFFPLSAPVMSNFKMQVDAVFVPSRIVSKKLEKFFNAGTKDADRPAMVSIDYEKYVRMLVRDIGFFTPRIWDYLGYPTFENLKDAVRIMFTTMHNDILDANLFDFSTLINSDNYSRYLEDVGDEATYVNFNEDYTFKSYSDQRTQSPLCVDRNGMEEIIPFRHILVCMYRYEKTHNFDPLIKVFSMDAPTSAAFYAWLGHYTDLSNGSSVTVQDIITRWCSVNKINAIDLTDMYMNCLSYELWEMAVLRFDLINPGIGHFFLDMLFNTDVSNTDATAFLAKRLSLHPLVSFWKAYFDWYVNSVLENGQELTDQFTDMVTDWINQDLEFDDDVLGQYQALVDFFGTTHNAYAFSEMPQRLWSVDRFTGAYTDTQNGPAVRIPVDGTIRDLKATDAYYAFLQKSMFGGTRTIDKNEIVYGAHSSNQLLDRTEVLCRKDFYIDVQQVTNQTSSETFQLGQLAGQGYGVGSSFLFDYTCEERGYVIIMASVVLQPSYMQALDRNLMHTDYYDFVIPEFDQIGEQEINPEELYFDKEMSLMPIGYNRRYYEAIDFLSSVHGDMKNSLRHWHDARFFSKAPSLSPEFIRINPDNDDLDRIFASYNHEQIMHRFFFSGAVVRPMSKFVEFGL